MRSWLGVLVLFTTWSAADGVAQTSVDMKLQLGGRVQTQFSTTSVDEEELLAAGAAPGAIPRSTFEARRVRLAAVVEYQKWLGGKVEADLANGRLQVRDAFMNMNFDPALQLRVGQFKKPFSLLQLASSTTWPVIERGVRIRGLSEAMAHRDTMAGGPAVLQRFQGSTVIGEEQELLQRFRYQDYDLGVSAHGRIGGFGYHAGLFNGAGADRIDDTNAKAYAARVTYRVPMAVPVTVGAAASHREHRVTSRPVLTTSAGTAYEVDVEVGEFRRPGLRFMGEVTMGDNLQATADEFVGAQGVLAYYRPLQQPRLEGIEVAGRVSYGDPRREIELDEGMLLTPGINLYFSGRNRLMLNWDVFLTGDRFENENALRAQAQFYF